jgi:hypothetical protein
MDEEYEGMQLLLIRGTHGKPGSIREPLAHDHLVPLDQAHVSCNGRDSQKKSPHQRKVLLMRDYFNRFSMPVIRLISKDLVRL